MVKSHLCQTHNMLYSLKGSIKKIVSFIFFFIFFIDDFSLSVFDACLQKRSKINALLQQKDTVWWRSSQWHFKEVSQCLLQKKIKRRGGKKIEENKIALHKYIEGWGSSFCCLSKLCLPITAMSIV